MESSTVELEKDVSERCQLKIFSKIISVTISNRTTGHRVAILLELSQLAILPEGSYLNCLCSLQHVSDEVFTNGSVKSKFESIQVLQRWQLIISITYC